MKKIYPNPFKIEIPEKRNFGLDLLRFIAIFTVLISHAFIILPPKFQFVHLFITDGVLIFFVLSGFLIGRILIRDFQDGISPNKMIYFWKRRWFRTIPAYLFTIFIIILLSYLTHTHFDKVEVLKTIFFVQNISYSPESFFIESWSLSIEEWFYLSLPILLLFFHYFFKFSIKKNIVISFIVILLLSNFIRFYYFFNLKIDSLTTWDNVFRKPVITRLDSILIGVLGAWVFHFKRKFFEKNINLLFFIGIAIFSVNKIFFDYFLTFNIYSCVIYFTLIPLSILFMFPKFYYMKETKIPIFNNIISKTSLISYSLYLINLTIIYFLILEPLEINIYVKFALFWILTVLGSIIMYKYIELPFMKLRDKKIVKEKKSLV